MERMSTFAWLFAVLAIAGLALVLVVLSSKAVQQERDKLLQAGNLAEAEILGYERGEFHLVLYRFVPVGRVEPVECKKIIAHWDSQYPVGSKVPVRYKPGLPSVSLLVPYAKSQSPSS